MPSASPHILLLAPGAKMALARALARAAEARGGRLTAREADPVAPAAGCCHHTVSGAPIDDADAAASLLDWCRREGVDLVVPSRHGDLPALASAREAFFSAGIALAISEPDCIRICLDKRNTWRWLSAHGLPVPAQTTVGEWPDSPLRDHLPLIAKSPTGSGSRQLVRVTEPAALAMLPADWILQTPAPGREYTVNVYVDRHGRSVCEIPHARLMVGDGEVIRARTERIPVLMTLARRIAEGLPGARGPLNIQMFHDDRSGRTTVIEINPRFGGGYPLVEEAGGTFAEWLIAEYIEGRDLPRLDTWEDGLLMVRYREALFLRP